MLGAMDRMFEQTPPPNDIDADEWNARLRLAACYRVFAHLGWDELIYNHITVKLPGTGHFLINPYGLHYREVRASNLVKIDLDGTIVPGPGPANGYRVNPAGIVIHTAIHSARPDAVCIAHTHTDAGSAVACQRQGLRSDNFYSSILHGAVAYHDFEGITVRADEKPRLVANLGSQNFLILRNHGLLTCGDSIPATFMNLWVLQRACELQLAADACGTEVIGLSPEVCQASAGALKVMTGANGYGELEFAAMVRQLEDRSWRE